MSISATIRWVKWVARLSTIIWYSTAGVANDVNSAEAYTHYIASPETWGYFISCVSTGPAYRSQKPPPALGLLHMQQKRKQTKTQSDDEDYQPGRKIYLSLLRIVMIFIFVMLYLACRSDNSCWIIGLRLVTSCVLFSDIISGHSGSSCILDS